MPTITDLIPCRRNRGRIAVHLDGEYAFSLPLGDSAVLERGQFLTENQVRKYREADERHQAYQIALRYLGYRARTVHMVRQELIRRGYPRGTTAETIERLQKEGLLDDVDYARRYVRERLHLKPRSSNLLRQELYRKGIRGDAAEAVLESVDDRRLARRIVDLRWPRWRYLSPERRKTKLLGYLRNRGFSPDVCMQSYRYACSLPETSA
ncbi:MAG TPA: regulatory protein RecX [Desulfobacterales bacterium]